MLTTRSTLSAAAAALLLVLLLATFHVTVGDESQNKYTFALVVKQAVNNPFFQIVGDGCRAKAQELGNVECRFVGPDEEDAAAQAEIIQSLIDEGTVDGMAIAAIDGELTGAMINKAMDAGIPVVAFDGDAPESKRLAFIGTNNTALGYHVGKVLLQLRPEGGSYGLIASTSPNLQERADGVRSKLADSKWTEVDVSPKDALVSPFVLQHMWDFGQVPDLGAVLVVGGWLMADPNITAGFQNFVDANRNITTVHTDATPRQMELMGEGYVDGLAGQLPYQMGEIAVDVLMQVMEGIPPQQSIFGTHLIEVLRVPLVLPELNVDMNYKSNLRILGYVLFAIIAALSVGFAMWTFVHRKTRVVKASQPMFLVMICAGTLILGSSIIPMTFDDERYSKRACDRSCMAIPWLISIGFTTAFSALFSKTWRINKLFHNPARFQRIKVTERDVIVPYVVLMALNVIVLVCWTTIAPHQYHRESHLGTDDWNRIISTYGYCKSNGTKGGGIPFLVILAVINFVVLVIANVQAFRARSIHTEFSESRYIAIINVCLLQAFVLAIPIIFLTRDLPKSFFVVSSIFIFVVCMAILLFMFVPKIRHLKKWKRIQKQQSETRSVSNAARETILVRDGDNGMGNRRQHRRLSAGDRGLQFALCDSAVVARNGIRDSIAVQDRDDDGVGDKEHETSPRLSTGDKGLKFARFDSMTIATNQGVVQKVSGTAPGGNGDSKVGTSQRLSTVESGLELSGDSRIGAAADDLWGAGDEDCDDVQHTSDERVQDIMAILATVSSEERHKVLENLSAGLEEELST